MSSYPFYSFKMLGRHVCRTKLRPKNFQIDTKNGLKTRKKIRKTIRNATEKCSARLRPFKNISLALFNKILKVFHRPKFAPKKSPRGSAGVTRVIKCALVPSFVACDRNPYQKSRHQTPLELEPLKGANPGPKNSS